MKNKALTVILSVIILFAAGFFIITRLSNSPLPETGNSESRTDKTDEAVVTDELFTEPVSNQEPQTSESSGAATTRYEPVYPVNISGEGVKQGITLHHIVPAQYRDTYYQLLNALKRYEKDIRLSSPVSEDVFLHSLIYVRDLNPELFFIDWSVYNYKTTSDNKVAEVNFGFLHDDAEEKMAEFEAKVGEIVNQANKYPNLFERELFVHDYLVNNTTYLIDNADTGSAYGVLINKKARCEGYARAFQLLMLRLGVPTFSVIGTAENEKHMWNAVNLYGKYYFVDVTFDDNSAEKAVTNYRESEISHSCFNMPEEIIARTHRISESGSRDKYGSYQNLFLPECNSYDFCYYRIRGLMVENSEQFKYILEKNTSEKRACVFFKGEMPSNEKLQDDFKSFFESIYSSGGYSIYYTPTDSPVYQRNVYEISWTVE